VIDRAFRWFDDRLHVANFTRSSMRKIFPDNWSFMLGEIALYCFVVLVQRQLAALRRAAEAAAAGLTDPTDPTDPPTTSADAQVSSGTVSSHSVP